MTESISDYDEKPEEAPEAVRRRLSVLTDKVLDLWPGRIERDEVAYDSCVQRKYTQAEILGLIETMMATPDLVKNNLPLRKRVTAYAQYAEELLALPE